jgi:PhnB protein
MVDPIPAHLRTVTPSLVCTPCADAIDLCKRALGAVEAGPRMTGPDGSVGHAGVRIGDSVIMLDEWPVGPTVSPTTLGGPTAALFIHTDGVEALWQRAVDAGARSSTRSSCSSTVTCPERLHDPFGHTWGLGQHVEDVDEQEMARRVAARYGGDSG